MDDSLRAYAEGRATRRGAESYATKYERQWHKRVSARREKALLGLLLAAAGPQDDVLDLPCGAGRLSPVLAPFVRRRLVEADFSPDMLGICRTVPLEATRRAFVRANALALPFRDGAFDLVVSIRLCHHIGDEDGRLRYFREMFRVSRRFVIATYFDHASLKNAWRRVRSALLGRAPKRTLRRAQVDAVARESGFVVRDSRTISRVFSGHRFVLLERAGDRQELPGTL